jgi:hypothetical protein
MKTLLSRFPVRVALVSWVVYLATLSWGVTLNSLVPMAQVAGGDWQPMADHLLFWLLTLPVRLLPSSWMLISFNLLCALCGAATLGIMTRTWELLPWSRPLEAAEC